MNQYIAKGRKAVKRNKKNNAKDFALLNTHKKNVQVSPLLSENICR